MGEGCEIFLEKDVYCPGEQIQGRVECNFSTEHKVRAIKVRFKGRTKVHWREQRTSRYADEKYFEMESNLLLSETDFAPGSYSYPFTFDLPTQIPSSMNDIYGDIKYTVTATVDKPWAVDYTCKKLFRVFLNHEIMAIDCIEKPEIFRQQKIPTTLFSNSAPIEITVILPRNGYFPNQMVSFTARVKNISGVKVQEVCFQIVQGFKFMSANETKLNDTYKGQKFSVMNSTIESGKENSWDLELRITPNIYIGSLDHCRIIKVFWELQLPVLSVFPMGLPTNRKDGCHWKKF